jgi:hypothetical protein
LEWKIILPFPFPYHSMGNKLSCYDWYGNLGKEYKFRELKRKHFAGLGTWKKKWREKGINMHSWGETVTLCIKNLKTKEKEMV